MGPLGFGRRLCGPLLSIQRLDGADVVFAELHEGVPAPVEGRHDGLPHVGVGEPEAVAQLVGQGLQHVGAPVGGDGPVLGVVHVDVAAVLREVGVGEGAAGAVEGIAVTVLVLLEPGGEGNDDDDDDNDNDDDDDDDENDALGAYEHYELTQCRS